MKKLIIVLCILFLCSCEIVIRDNDGFAYWNFSRIPQNCVVVQSHEGYMVNGELYFESYFDLPVTVKNVTPNSIDLRITYITPYNQYWLTLAPYEKLVLKEVTDGQDIN